MESHEVIFNMNYFFGIPPFEADTLEIGIAVVTSITITRFIRWLKAKIGSPIPQWAFKCGKDERNNNIYLGRCFIHGSPPMVVCVNPVRNTVTTAYEGREWPQESYDLLEDSGRYGWTSIGEDKKIPEYAIYQLYLGDRIYIGRVALAGAVILVTLPPLEALNKLLKEVQKNPAKKALEDTPPENKCVICYTEEITTAFLPCGHLGFCEPCAKELFKRTNKCPICQKHATSHSRIYKVV